ncbi:hypothetical protein BDV98DRAFT_569892 [Pterulicium gracile]|uniref:Uncharacterized protein n=1 Tax=Pterulicium gracile TaxID=1884261 RepID=A0A5C3QDA7_9AGAR|nr:hypothetical protein BDV98DRAFT_569892 [Pterula gracilis]
MPPTTTAMTMTTTMLATGCTTATTRTARLPSVGISTTARLVSSINLLLTRKRSSNLGHLVMVRACPYSAVQLTIDLRTAALSSSPSAITKVVVSSADHPTVKAGGSSVARPLEMVELVSEPPLVMEMLGSSHSGMGEKASLRLQGIRAMCTGLSGEIFRLGIR